MDSVKGCEMQVCSQEMAVILWSSDKVGWHKIFNNGNSGEFDTDSQWSWSEATQVDLNFLH